MENTTPRSFMSEADKSNSDCCEFCKLEVDSVLNSNSSDEPETFAGAPLCLQLVSRRFADEIVVKALQEISRALPLRG